MIIRKEKNMMIGILSLLCFLTGCNSEPDKVIKGESSTTESSVTTTETVTEITEAAIVSETDVIVSDASENGNESMKEVFTEEQLQKIEELISPKDYEKFISVIENGKVTVEENELDRKIIASDSGDKFIVEISVDVIISIQRGDTVLFTAY